jgi:hypothetical protein
VISANISSITTSANISSTFERRVLCLLRQLVRLLVSDLVRWFVVQASVCCKASLDSAHASSSLPLARSQNDAASEAARNFALQEKVRTHVSFLLRSALFRLMCHPVVKLDRSRYFAFSVCARHPLPCRQTFSNSPSRSSTPSIAKTAPSVCHSSI